MVKTSGKGTLLCTMVMAGASMSAATVRAQDEHARHGTKAHSHSARALLGDIPGGINGPPRNPKTSNPSATPQIEGDNPTIVTPKKASAQSKSTITSDAVQNSGASNTYDAIKNVPGVTQSDAKGTVADNVQIRGIHLNSVTGYRLEGGMPIVNNLIMPLEDKERIETLKGASALAFGLASPAGVVSYSLKRATALPILTYSVNLNHWGQAIGTLDIGRRFGFDKQFGVRVVLAGGGITNGVHNTEGVRGVGSVAFDWNPNDRLAVKLDFEQYGVDTIEQAQFLENTKLVNGRVQLPTRVPTYIQLFSGPWSKYQGVGQNVLLAGAYKLDYGWSIVAEAGRSDARKLTRSSAQIGNYNIFTGLGTETVTLIPNQYYVNTYLKGELHNHWQYAFITNDLTLGINRNERDNNGTATVNYPIARNIYTPFVTATPPVPTPGIYAPQNDYDLGYYVSEDVGLFDRLHVLGGVRQVEYYGFAVPKTGVGLNTEHTSFTAPAGGLIYRVWHGIELYGSYVESLQESGEAPQNATNQFQVISPAPANQKEAGIRVTDLYDATATLAWFRLNQGNGIIDPVTGIYGINGIQDVRGVEATLRYNIFPQLIHLALVAGGQIGYANQHSSNPAINGKEAENTPRQSGNIGFVYKPDFIRGLSLNGGALYTGSRQLTNTENGTIPAVTVFNLGMNYATFVEGHRVTYNVSCQNLLNKAYYSAAVNGALGIGRPRTVYFGGRLEF